MLTKTITANKKPVEKENILANIKNQLNDALPSVKEQLGEKKFKKRIKKVAKLLIAGIKEIKLKKPARTAKKATTLKKVSKSKSTK